MSARTAPLGFDHPTTVHGSARLLHVDCFAWLAQLPAESLAAIVSDPPYGVKEYEVAQVAKLRGGQGGVWRIPPSFDGHQRAPLPRFTALTAVERATLHAFFVRWTTLAAAALKPGGHVFLASNTFLSQLVFSAVVAGGLEFRGELIRLVGTLRGGDRPKGAEQEFPDVCVLPRGQYEPWGVFRKPLPRGSTVASCLRAHGTGALRRLPDGRPLGDVLPSERTPRRERALAGHPSIKPQSFLRLLAHCALPLGTGVIADPFAGSGSTLAAAAALGLDAIGTERDPEYYALAAAGIPRLAALDVVWPFARAGAPAPAPTNEESPTDETPSA